MPDDADYDKSLPWSLPQRRAILLIFCGVLAYLASLVIRDRQYIPDPLPDRSPLADQLADKIDPNTADLATLAAIPNLGEKRAAAVIAYREKVRQREPGAVAFQHLDDLLKIRGIGVAMVANLRPYLILPGDTAASSTKPAERLAD